MIAATWAPVSSLEVIVSTSQQHPLAKSGVKPDFESNALVFSALVSGAIPTLGLNSPQRPHCHWLLTYHCIRSPLGACATSFPFLVNASSLSLILLLPAKGHSDPVILEAG